MYIHNVLNHIYIYIYIYTCMNICMSYTRIYLHDHLNNMIRLNLSNIKTKQLKPATKKTLVRPRSNNTVAPGTGISN